MDLVGKHCGRKPGSAARKEPTRHGLTDRLAIPEPEVERSLDYPRDQ